jgi:hypothetical protein
MTFESGIKVKVSEHESGCQKTYFSCFECQSVTREHFSAVFELARQTFGVTPITQVYLKSHQNDERKLLEDMGFVVDGLEYSFDVYSLANLCRDKACDRDSERDKLDDFEIRAIHFEQDIAQVVALEKSIHAADATSRVNFDTEASIESMKQYYRRVSAEQGVFVLQFQEKIIGVVGFMRSSQDNAAVQVSSVGLNLDHQGQGLFFPFIYQALLMSPFKHVKTLTGVTTTTRLIAASEKHKAKISGRLLIRREIPGNVLPQTDSV